MRSCLEILSNLALTQIIHDPEIFDVDEAIDSYALVFQFRTQPFAAPIRVIAANGLGWDHVSVSLQTRCPSWSEMKMIKMLCFRPDELAVQLHPPVSDNIDVHPFCLHLWRSHAHPFVMPPRELV